MWTCSNCKRKFKLEDQWHSCYVIEVDSHFKNKSEKVRLLFDLLVTEMKKFGPLVVIAVKSAIVFKAGSNFASVKIKKEHIDLEFQISRELELFPITVVARLSKNRVVHATTIDEIEQIDEFLISLLKESYLLISKRK
jgi:hypothetical protein